MEIKGKMGKASVHWFRHGLRLHDNPALLESIMACEKFYAIFIVDEDATEPMGYNRMQYLTESLRNLDAQLRALGGQLYVMKGEPTVIFKILHAEAGMARLTLEQVCARRRPPADCDATWDKHDKVVRRLCEQLGVEVVEKMSNTLWEPSKIIEANGGEPPHSYEMFMQVTSTLGMPPRPSPNPEWEDVLFGELTDELAAKLGLFPHVPTPEELGYYPENNELTAFEGGETAALALLQERLKVEEDAFRDGYILPNQVNPDILGPSLSMSAAIRFGCLSVRKFYWEIQEIYFRLHRGIPPPLHSLTAQLVWREFFYCMAANNPHYNEVSGNPLCIDIPWFKNSEYCKAWEEGFTGYPFIDACMRQLRKEGWIHHVCRTAVACFLTRGDLWISWEEGLKVFMKYLVDADWAICSGNWMWVSASAFERQLDSSCCICPVSYGKKIEPTGEYIRRYVPELASLPQEYIHEPWLAPLDVQKASNCILGYNYPHRIVIHEEVSKENKKMMENIKHSLRTRSPHNNHCPSSVREPSLFLWVPQSFHRGSV